MNINPKILRVVGVLVLIYLCSCMADGAEVDRERFLAAVVAVEGTPGHGSNGELGKYQFTAQTWRQHSTKPFRWALGHTSEARLERDRVANAHASWLARHLDNPNVYRMALAWNAGLSCVQRNGFSDTNVSYATRVQNVYIDISTP